VANKAKRLDIGRLHFNGNIAVKIWAARPPAIRDGDRRRFEIRGLGA
jgi:hypothetical protein